MGVHLMGVHLMGVHLMAMHLTGRVSYGHAPHGHTSHKHASHRRDGGESQYRCTLDNGRVGRSDSFNISMIKCRAIG
jgi:hypothetical protein